MRYTGLSLLLPLWVSSCSSDHGESAAAGSSSDSLITSVGTFFVTIDSQGNSVGVDANGDTIELSEYGYPLDSDEELLAREQAADQYNAEALITRQQFDDYLMAMAERYLDLTDAHALSDDTVKLLKQIIAANAMIEECRIPEEFADLIPKVFDTEEDARAFLVEIGR